MSEDPLKRGQLPVAVGMEVALDGEPLRKQVGQGRQVVGGRVVDRHVHAASPCEVAIKNACMAPVAPGQTS
jgi:hypothetical protein